MYAYTESVYMYTCTIHVTVYMCIYISHTIDVCMYMSVRGWDGWDYRLGAGRTFEFGLHGARFRWRMHNATSATVTTEWRATHCQRQPRALLLLLLRLQLILYIYLPCTTLRSPAAVVPHCCSYTVHTHIHTSSVTMYQQRFNTNHPLPSKLTLDTNVHSSYFKKIELPLLNCIFQASLMFLWCYNYGFSNSLNEMTKLIL